MDTLFTNQRDQSEDFYAILGCDELSTKEQIQTEYRLKALQFHPDKNLDDPTAMMKFKILQEAKDVLCDDSKRKAYDAWRNSQLTIPWKTWSSMTERSQPTFHWVVTKKEPMIESGQTTQEKTSINSSKNNNSPWRSDESSVSETLRRFRNYEI